MSGHLWAGRLVVAVSGVLLGFSVLFALQWSAPPAQAAHARLAGAARAAGTATPPPALFRDDFERDRIGAQPAGWTIDDGRWDGVVQDGSHVVQHATGSSYGHLAAGSADWTDYAVSARLRLTPLSTGFAGVAARYQDRDDYYACGVYYASAVRLWRVRAGVMTLLDARRMDVATNRFHDVRLVVNGGTISCEFDETVELTATDGSFANGRIAFVAASDEAAELDDVVVTGPTNPHS
jgi:pectate lyase